jgi:cell division protein FtsL
MSLAAEWKGSPGQPARDAGKEVDRHKQKARKQARASIRRKRIFVCLMATAALLAALFIGSVFLRVMTAQNEVRLRDVQAQMDLEKRQQESLRVQIAGLESPARIEKVAVNTLHMVRVPWAVYVQTDAYKSARLSERQVSNREATAGGAQGG